MTANRFDPLDGYSPTSMNQASDFKVPDLHKHHDGREPGPWNYHSRLDDMLHLDGYQNRLTGVGDPARDKSYGGHWNGPDFCNQFLTGWEAQERWRGSDLGSRIIETIPREMLRKGWKLEIQPDPDDDTPAPRRSPPLDSALVIEALKKEQERLGLSPALLRALCYERNFGGGAILLGVDDGETDLTRPLDPRNVRRIKHLTPFRGGWDGELIAVRWYVDPRAENFGRPEIYQLRNLGVPLSTPPVPGESVQSGAGRPGSLVFYVHESRLLLFDGDPKSNWAAVQMRGWGDGIWMQVNQVLAQYCQSWEGIAILLQELGSPILHIKDFDKFMSAQDGSGIRAVTNRAMVMQMAMSIAKVRILDNEEKMDRLPTQLEGVPEVMQEFAKRLAAAAGMPVSLLMGQVQGGLGDASKGDISFFDDQIAGLQTTKLTPVLHRFVELQLTASQGVSGGRVPRRWSVAPNPLREMTPAEQAKYRLDVAAADGQMLDRHVVTPEEVANTRFGSAEYNDGPIVLDLAARAARKKAEPAPPTDTTGVAQAGHPG